MSEQKRISNYDMKGCPGWPCQQSQVSKTCKGHAGKFCMCMQKFFSLVMRDFVVR